MDGAGLTLTLDTECVWAHVWTGTGVCGDVDQPSPCSQRTPCQENDEDLKPRLFRKGKKRAHTQVTVTFWTSNPRVFHPTHGFSTRHISLELLEDSSTFKFHVWPCIEPEI